MKRIIVFIFVLLLGLLQLNAQPVNQCIYPTGNWIEQVPLDVGGPLYNEDWNGYLYYLTTQDITNGIHFPFFQVEYGKIKPSISQVISQGINRIIENSHIIFHISDPTIEYVINIEIPSCWGSYMTIMLTDGGHHRNSYFIEGCPNSPCCKVSLTLKMEYGKIRVKEKNVISTPDNCNGLIGPSQGSNCELFICGIIDAIPVEPGENTEHGPCYSDIDCGGESKVTELEPIPYTENGVTVKVIPKFEITKCSDGTIKMAFQEVSLSDGSWENISERMIALFCMQYALKFLTGNENKQDVVISIPCFDKTTNMIIPCEVLNCCKITFHLNRTNGILNIKQGESLCGFNPDVPDFGDGIDDFHLNEPILPNLEPGCDLQCYWRVDGNSLIVPNNFIGPTNGEDFVIKTGEIPNNFERMRITTDGLIGIGTSTPEELLHVNGNIKANNMKVDNKLIVGESICTKEVLIYDPVCSWPDYIFDKDYKLMSLNELELYINNNNALPGIPKLDEIKNDGFKMSELQIKLLQKVEELTLYVIELKKENELLKKAIMQKIK